MKLGFKMLLGVQLCLTFSYAAVSSSLWSIVNIANAKYMYSCQ